MNLAKNKYRWNKIRGSKVNISIDAPLEGGGDGSGEERRIDLPDDRMAPDEKSAFKELEKNVRDELDNLPDIYREALVMRNVEEMSYEDIANALNCKLGTIKSRIARGREELRKRLGL